jgi:hypothetical protein
MRKGKYSRILSWGAANVATGHGPQVFVAAADDFVMLWSLALPSGTIRGAVGIV